MTLSVLDVPPVRPEVFKQASFAVLDAYGILNQGLNRNFDDGRYHCAYLRAAALLAEAAHGALVDEAMRMHPQLMQEAAARAPN